MPNPANNKLIPSVIKLASLLSEAKTQPDKVRLNTIHDNVVSLIFIILRDVENDQLPAFFPEKTIPKILDKIQVALHEFKEFDTENALHYEELAKEVNDCKSKRHTSAVGSSSPSLDESAVGDSMQLEELTVDDGSLLQDRFESLSLEEKNCLFCFCLFAAGIEVKKREPIHLWVAMDLVADPLIGSEMLAGLVTKGFIERRIIQNKRFCNGYKMNPYVRFMVVKAMNIDFAPVKPFSIMGQKKGQRPSHRKHEHQKTFVKRLGAFRGKNKDDTDGLGTLVLNLSEDILQARISMLISKEKNNIKVLHLGNWSHNSERYIVVEELDEALKDLTKHAGEVTLLSLEGISGIIELSDFIYKLENLKVLDLRGCPNLKSLSEGINSLKQLMHLDLSECYLLDHLPKEIASLTELRVLKGFIINPDDPQVGNENGNRNTKERISSSSASFSDLKTLKKLMKLSIRTRQTNFPASSDFDTLCAMEELACLSIAWVLNSSSAPIESASERFPTSLKKLELQATPENTVSRLLRLISSDTRNSLQKLYIRGGQLWDLGLGMHKFHHVQIVRLRYLPDLQIDWNEFRNFFPNLTRLEVLGCPKLINFPCKENGVSEINIDY